MGEPVEKGLPQGEVGERKEDHGKLEAGKDDPRQGACR